jgi:hypothetical protein
MTDSIAKITKVLLWVLIALSIFFALMLFMNTTEEDVKWVGNSLKFTYVILILAIAAVILSSLYIFTMKLIAKPKSAIMTIITIGILGVIFLIAYSKSSDIPLDMPNYEGPDNVPGPLKWSDTGLFMMYILFGLSLLAILYAEISRLFK